MTDYITFLPTISLEYLNEIGACEPGIRNFQDCFGVDEVAATAENLRLWIEEGYNPWVAIFYAIDAPMPKKREHWIAIKHKVAELRLTSGRLEDASDELAFDIAEGRIKIPKP